MKKYEYPLKASVIKSNSSFSRAALVQAVRAQSHCAESRELLQQQQRLAVCTVTPRLR